MREAGLTGAALDYAVGGRQLTTVVANACMAWFRAASVGTAAYPFLTVGDASLLQAHGSKEQIDACARPMARAASSAPCASPSRRPAPR
ncbi:hypothetical protein [Streptomyces griseoruber]|uniref:Uncharacterized protein n=1 Tax=Streptomyces griseoruber TaxID=1943 RepID=A0A101SQI5_9ACTN|nr:hypothetical protein [Streptomyces griseoruber]KUN78109.1 hypothetical protein AQJ64_32075 [Streptomyces griseoruber]